MEREGEMGGWSKERGCGVKKEIEREKKKKRGRERKRYIEIEIKKKRYKKIERVRKKSRFWL